ncbi:MAG: ankyrin repeat domain-containing protein [Nitrospiraceae bacterium]
MQYSNWITATLAGLLFVSVPAALAGPLHDAAKSGDAATVGQLIAGGVDVDEKDAGFNTALHWAADKGHLEVIRVLAAKGADINDRDIGDWTPLHKAVLGKHADAVQFLIAKGADVNLLDSDGIASLDDATRYGLSGIIEMLKNAGAKCGTNHSYSRKCKEAEGQN